MAIGWYEYMYRYNHQQLDHFFKNLFRLTIAALLAFCDGKSTSKQKIPLTKGQ